MKVIGKNNNNNKNIKTYSHTFLEKKKKNVYTKNTKVFSIPIQF